MYNEVVDVLHPRRTLWGSAGFWELSSWRRNSAVNSPISWRVLELLHILWHLEWKYWKGRWKTGGTGTWTLFIMVWSPLGMSWSSSGPQQKQVDLWCQWGYETVWDGTFWQARTMDPKYQPSGSWCPFYRSSSPRCGSPCPQQRISGHSRSDSDNLRNVGRQPTLLAVYRWNNPTSLERWWTKLNKCWQMEIGHLSMVY